MNNDFIKVDIVPMSVNQAWVGRRFKTPKYKKYERDVLFMLPKIKLPEPPYKIKFIFAFSSSLSDLDNPVKPLQDLLQKKYKFNDKDIFYATITKILVPKGKEHFAFKIEHYEIINSSNR